MKLRFAALVATIGALVGWLALRSVEQQSRKLDAIENGRPESALEEDAPVASDKPAVTGNLALPRPRPNAAPVPAASHKPQPAAASGAAMDAAASSRLPQTANALPETEALPALPPPIEIHPAPGSGERKPQAKPRAAARPAGAPAPAPSRSIFNLFDSRY
jgi:large subunit ribosomal protein L24